MKKNRSNRGQFSVIAALLVSVIMVTAVISTYSMVRTAPLQQSPNVLIAVGEMNADIKRILDFTIGYYGSILKVTGNSVYAKNLASRYLASGLVNIGRSHPEWNPSLSLDSETFSTSWYMPKSYSSGNLSVTYSLLGLGIEGIRYEISSSLAISMLESDSGIARINVIRDDNEPELGLEKEDFSFYKYNFEDSNWELVNPESIFISSDGTYDITIPLGVDQDSYAIQVEDTRGLLVNAFYSQNSISGSGLPQYVYGFDWDSSGMGSIYDSLNTDIMSVELLQNGTLRWLGQNLELNPSTKPIPPIPVRSFHMNATINGINQEIKFQVEDWGSNYRIPLGLAGNNTLLNNNNMLVFLIDDSMTNVTLWWDGSDESIQTPNAWRNIHFIDDRSSGVLNNGFIRLNIHDSYVTSRVLSETTSYRADFLRVNNKTATYGSQPSFVIYNGIVRDIIQQEPEYRDGVVGCPNFYSQVYLTLPANAPYYTYTTRTIFLNSTQSRTISDLSAIQLSNLIGTALTEDGTDAGFPDTSSSTGLFFDGSPSSSNHHWSQISSVNSGAGIMFTDKDNENLYSFDSLTGDNVGAIRVFGSSIEYNPVELNDVENFDIASDLTWTGAVVNFSGEPIYPSSGVNGLWVMVEYPPTVTVS